MHQPHIGEDILDFAPLVEAGGADKAVAKIAPDAGFFEGAALRVCAVDDSCGAGSEPGFGAQAGCLVEDIFGLFGFVEGFVNPDLEAVTPICVESFGRSVSIL